MIKGARRGGATGPLSPWEFLTVLKYHA